MNTIDLLYRIFRTHYNLDELRQGLEKPYRLALLGDDEQVQRLKAWLGEPTLASGRGPDEGILVLGTPLVEESEPALRTVDAVLYHLGTEMPGEDFLRRQAECLPPGVGVLYLCETDSLEKDPPPEDPTLPRVHRVDPARAAELVPPLLRRTFPALALRLARDYSRVRLEYARSLTARTSARMAVLAAASSVTVSIPLLGQILSLMAVTGETMVITAEQLRLALLVGALYGRPLDFFDRVDELWPVVGGAMGWRTLARQLVGFVPVVGPVAKATVAWSGTWIVGESCRLFYEMGERLPEHVRKHVEQEARTRAAAEAARSLEALRRGHVEEGAEWPEEEGWSQEHVPPATAPPAEPAEAAQEAPPSTPSMARPEASDEVTRDDA